MKLLNFIFKRIDQLFIFIIITLFFILIMYFEKTPDEKEIDMYIGQAFNDICDVNGLESNSTMGSFRNMYCNSATEESMFSALALTYKLLYTSSRNLNMNILESMSSILKNDKTPYSPARHKLLLLLLYTVIYYLYIGIVFINNSVVKIFKFKKTKTKKTKIKKTTLGKAVLKSLNMRFTSSIFFIITISIFINFIKYICDIGIGSAQGSKLQGVFLIQMIIIGFVMLATGIFNKQPPSKCANNSKYLILIFVLMIPVITGIQQLITIVYRGIKGIIYSTNQPNLRILLSTIFIMVLLLFMIELLINMKF